MILTENPGRPYGSRPEDDEAVLTKPRHRAALPWHDQANGDGAPKLRAAEKPRRTIPGAPGPNDDLPCVGRWDLFDTEEPTDEAREMCSRCPFQQWCLTYAAANDEHWTWGGESRDERKAQAKAREKEKAA